MLGRRLITAILNYTHDSGVTMIDTKVVYDSSKSKRVRILDSIKAKPSADVPGETHICPSCKDRCIEVRYKRCYGCQAKWKKVFTDCLAVGWPQDYAALRADGFYPRIDK